MFIFITIWFFFNNAIHYFVTYWVLSLVTHSAFFDGTYMSIYFHGCKFIYLYLLLGYVTWKQINEVESWNGASKSSFMYNSKLIDQLILPYTFYGSDV